MNKHSKIYAVLGAALFVTTLTACGDDGGDTDTNATTNPGTTNPTTTTDGTTTVDAPTTSGDPTTDGTTNSPETTDGTTNVPTTDGTTDPTTDGTTDPTDGTTGDPGGFVFAPDAVEDYVQIDRHAAVEAGTAGILASAGLGLGGEDLSVRDMYNASNPVEDAMMKWFPEIAESVTFFHDALDDDIEGFGLVPATINETVAQAGPVILPDTIKYNPKMPTAYPNGRKLTDQVVDITLAAVLLKLGPNQPLNTFAELPLNPPENDVPFADEFPFLAPPHLK
jgi:hypothetical protein